MTNHIEIYQSDDGKLELKVALENETVWLSQAQMAELLGTKRPCKRPANAPVNVLTQIVGRKTPEAILLLLEANPALTRAQLADALGKDIRTIGRALAKLQQAGKVKRIGSDKTGHWEVHL